MSTKPPGLPRGTRFEVPRTGTKKYVAVLPGGERVGFGHRDYEQYRDAVPKGQGGGRWAQKNHGDLARRASYRARHGGLRCASGERCVDRRFSPAWFSYHFLW